MATKRIADDFLYGDREKRKERRTLRRKNIIERQLYKKNAKRLGDPSSYTNAMLGQMKTDDKGEMMALKNAQEFYTPIYNSQNSLSNSLKNLNKIETSLYGSPKTKVISGPAATENTQTGVNVDADIINSAGSGKRNPIKNIISNVREGIQTRKLRKQSLKTEYNNFIEDMKLIEGDDFDADRVPSYKKWKKKWNQGDFVGSGLPENDRERLKALQWNENNPDNQKVFHEGNYIFRSELEKIIDPTTGANIKEREQSFLNNMPKDFTSFAHLMTWQQKAGDHKFKEGEEIKVSGKNYVWNKDDGWIEAKEDKSLYSYRKSYNMWEDDKGGPLQDHLNKYYVGDLERYFHHHDPDYDFSSTSSEDDFNKYVEISQGWWDSDSGQEYKDKYNIKRKKQTGGVHHAGGLYHNINHKKKSGTSNSKKNSTISAKAYKNMKSGFKKQKGGCREGMECGGMYQDGGFLSPPVPRLFED
tara:strand:- start:3517 stop:4932 length:1416 start_codon:yes stop_codon:yes gene_type:complete